jgi:TonB family protein
VTLEASVDTEGHVNVLRTVKGLGYGLDERAIAAVLSWKFVPASRDGTPVQAITQIEVDFNLPPDTPLKVGNGVLPPTIISRVEPQYTEEARKAHWKGTVVLEAVIRKDGSCTIVRVVRALGLGLDESAIDALKQWRFRPATLDGTPVDVSLNVEVNFNLKDDVPKAENAPTP